MLTKNMLFFIIISDVGRARNVLKRKTPGSGFYLLQNRLAAQTTDLSALDAQAHFVFFYDEGLAFTRELGPITASCEGPRCKLAPFGAGCDLGGA